MLELKFVVRTPSNKPDLTEVRYDCPCGCKPRARFKKGTNEVGHEHCCCGIVHFAGDSAETHLKSYLDERSAQGMDKEVEGYQFKTLDMDSPEGAKVAIAYAVPNISKKHEEAGHVHSQGA
ncbi:MAG: hypothetical protein EXR59_05055 [Dehalococcoidia bacterium]|nr:hypothetical protein [Dehalococcoidia bacterium]